MSAAVALVALAADAAVGWPDRLTARIGHPVTWIGALIDRFETRWNDPASDPAARRAAGTKLTLLVVGVSALAGLVLAALLPDGWAGVVAVGLAAMPLVAARSLDEHVRAVARPLAEGRIEEARAAVAMIVGRRTADMPPAAIARGALESLAENTSDAVVAPLFWAVFLGLPGIAAYKAINTLDSMIGHRSPRYEDFGRSAARLDDAVNWLPARLTGALICIAGSRPRRAFSVMRRDARQHRSPNAGWPEAAMAASLGIRLSGPRVYDDRISDEPWLNGRAPDPGPEDCLAGLSLYRRTLWLFAACLAVLVIL